MVLFFLSLFCFFCGWGMCQPANKRQLLSYHSFSEIISSSFCSIEPQFFKTSKVHPRHRHRALELNAYTTTTHSHHPNDITSACTVSQLVLFILFGGCSVDQWRDHVQVLSCQAQSAPFDGQTFLQNHRTPRKNTKEGFV